MALSLAFSSSLKRGGWSMWHEKISHADSEEEEALDKEEEEEVLMLQQNMAARLDENDFDIEQFEVML